MREIRARAWDTKNNYWVPTGWVRALDGGELFSLDEDEDSSGCLARSWSTVAKAGEYILEEYIGIEDKNGREIYEGDIVKINMGRLEDDIFEIVFGGVWEYAAFGITGKSARHEGGYSWDTINPQYAAAMEVLGNVHENPELLK